MTNKYICVECFSDDVSGYYCNNCEETVDELFEIRNPEILKVIDNPESYKDLKFKKGEVASVYYIYIMNQSKNIIDSIKYDSGHFRNQDYNFINQNIEHA